LDQKQFTVFGSGVSAFSSVYFLVLPIVIGAAQRASDWSEAELGSIASTYLLSFTAAGVLAAQFHKLFRYPMVRFAASVLLGGGFLFAGFGSASLGTVQIGHGLAGLGAGALYSASFNLVAASRVPESAFGWKLSAEQALGSVAFFSMTALGLDFTQMLYVLGGLGLFSSFVFVIAPYGKLPVMLASGSTGWPPLIYIGGLLLIGLMMGALSGLWAFLEPITARAGLTQDDFGKIGAAGLVLGGFGGLTAGLIGSRFGNSWPLVFAGVALMLALFGFASGAIGLVSLSAFSFSFIWNLALAYQLSVASRLDPSGGHAGWMSPVIAGGATLGPLLAGSVLSGGGTVNALLLVTGTIGIGALFASARLGRA